MAVKGTDEGPELPGYLSVLQPEAEGRHHVENQVGVGGAGDHAEIVDTEGRIDAMGQLCDLIPEDNGCAVIRGDGVHVDHRLAAQLPVQLLFDVVDGVMDRHDAAGGRDLRVEGDHHPAGAVVMNHQIVNTGDLFVSHHQIFNFFNKFRRGGLSKQGIDGVLGGVYAALENEQCHQNTHPAIHRELEVMANQSGDQNGRGGHAISQRIRRCRQQRRCGEFFAEGAVIHGHIQLHADRNSQNPDHQPAELHQSGVQDLIQGLLGQFHAHQQNQHGYRQTGEVLRPAVAEGMAWVRRFGGNAEAQQRDHRGTGIREVVEGVRRDGDGAGEGPSKELAQKQQQVQPDPNSAAENTVGRP